MTITASLDYCLKCSPDLRPLCMSFFGGGSCLLLISDRTSDRPKKELHSSHIIVGCERALSINAQVGVWLCEPLPISKLES